MASSNEANIKSSIKYSYDGIVIVAFNADSNASIFFSLDHSEQAFFFRLVGDGKGDGTIVDFDVDCCGTCTEIEIDR